MLDLESAIKHCEEVAEEKFNEAQESIMCNRFQYADDCRDCAEEHRQLAEWLKKLQAYEKAEEEINRKMKSGQWSDAVVYGMGKALLIMHKHIKEVNADGNSD